MQPRSDIDDLARFKSEAMGFLAGLVPITGIVFYSVDTNLNPVDHAFHRIESDRNERYTEFFHRLDPFHPRRFAATGKRIVSLRDLHQRYHGGEYHRRFMAPLGLDYEAELYLYRTGQMVGGVSLHRSSEQGDFTPRELELLGNARHFLEHTFTTGRSFEAARRVDEWGLTQRERDVLRLIREGAANADIGRVLYISVPTVKTHLQHIYDKSGLRSRAQLIARLGATD
ncbi:helix-turn-helix transcriptional regulator [Rhodococcus maanshanensis]|uniref:Regulatory protein, luxR family n=1 Tax=Rhodococcus maanshanensis TaxID=183556 RepID=A0A1H7P4B8_9NOCA|nr:helix-turn-helix transcriptional regulator [Rhodococcus maanshanensis]SEL29947.1 regulatory protein, luxR family [Rhodococcus maanshanensis]